MWGRNAHDQRTASTYIFGAACPKEGKGAALVVPARNTKAINLSSLDYSTTKRAGCFSGKSFTDGGRKNPVSRSTTRNSILSVSFLSG